MIYMHVYTQNSRRSISLIQKDTLITQQGKRHPLLMKREVTGHYWRESFSNLKPQLP